MCIQWRKVFSESETIHRNTVIYICHVPSTAELKSLKLKTRYNVYFPISQNFCLFWRKNSAFCMTLSICTIVHHHFSVHLSSLLQAATAVQLLLGSQAFTKGIKLPTFIRLDFKHCVELPPDSQYILGQ